MQKAWGRQGGEGKGRVGRGVLQAQRKVVVAMVKEAVQGRGKRRIRSRPQFYFY